MEIPPKISANASGMGILRRYYNKYSRTFISRIASEETISDTAQKEKVNNFYSFVLPSLISKYFDHDYIREFKLYKALSKKDILLQDNGFVCFFHECLNQTYYETQNCIKRHLISHHYEEIPAGGIFLLPYETFDRYICRKCCERFFSHQLYKTHLDVCRRLALFEVSEDESNEKLPMIKYTDEWHYSHDSFSIEVRTFNIA